MNLLPQLSHASPNISARLLAFFVSHSLASLIVLLCLIASPAFAVTYSDNGDGTVTDPATGLTWMRCAMGQIWNGGACTGMATTYWWDRANELTGTVGFAGNGDWRLPNIRELQSIVDRSGPSPALDSAAFPETAAVPFWSATVYADYPTTAWYVYFGNGSAYGDSYKDDAFQVRLVRAGSSRGLIDIARPGSDYVDHGDGTVTHAPTGLMWKRCAEGQTWSAGTCAGGAASFSWDAARLLNSMFAGRIDWRIPTEEELLTLVDYTVTSPVLNKTVFPNTPATNFWSATGYAAGSAYAWSVGFFTGRADYSDRNDGSHVRLVRAGQSIGSYASTTTTTSTTVAGTTTTSLAGQAGTLNFVAGWNLVGNGSTGSIDVTAVLGDAARISTVWKWIAAQSTWAFHAPALAAQGGTALADYAASKGYQLLTMIAGSEGFWVNVKQAGSVDLSNGNAIGVTTLGPTLIKGWNLVSVGETVAPKQFCDAQSDGVTTLWAWDATNSGWYFYAPSLAVNGGLGTYITSKGYLDFTASGKTLGPGVGFWVNKP